MEPLNLSDRGCGYDRLGPEGRDDAKYLTGPVGARIHTSAYIDEWPGSNRISFPHNSQTLSLWSATES